MLSKYPLTISANICLFTGIKNAVLCLAEVINSIFNQLWQGKLEQALLLIRLLNANSKVKG